jgi:hypothetical protein
MPMLDALRYADHKFQAVAKELAGDICEVDGAHLAYHSFLDKAFPES